jgi:glucose-1-phosphate cytidylyltransferase
MKAVILAGGYGSRIAEETITKPKPMIEIGEKPILWHIMKIYSHYGINEFIICLGYKGSFIKDYFINYASYNSDVTLDIKNDSMNIHDKISEPWKVTLVDTGLNTMTGGRIKRIGKYVKKDESFCLTYGDGLADIDISKLIAHHKKSKLEATVTGVSPPGRYGVIETKNGLVSKFSEKTNQTDILISGGFFVLNPSVLKKINNDQTVWEKKPLETLAKNGQLNVYKHNKFWQSMDTLREKKILESLWVNKKAPWKIWK